MPQTKPTMPQRAALQRFASANGRTWKSKLSIAWSNGDDEHEPDASELRQVRNSLGPTWLMRHCDIRP